MTRSITMELQMSLKQGRRAQEEGIIFESTVHSDEATETIPPLLCTENGCQPL